LRAELVIDAAFLHVVRGIDDPDPVLVEARHIAVVASRTQQAAHHSRRVAVVDVKDMSRRFGKVERFPTDGA
jgi:hypothetical protein